MYKDKMENRTKEIDSKVCYLYNTVERREDLACL